MFQFIPLLGAQSENRASASLLLLDNGIKILVDCGWSEPFDVKDLAEIQSNTPTIDLILLTHPTISHVGAYAHCCAHIPLFSQIPVYCTYPVANLGRTLLQDAYLSQPLIHTFMPSAPKIKTENGEDAPTTAVKREDTSMSNVLLQPPSPEDIDRYFDAMHPLKYSQPFQFQAPLTGLTVTAYRAGHTLGGTIWRIQHLQENILYSVDWNHSRDAHLSSAALLPSTTGMGGAGGGGPGAGKIPEEFLKPTAMVCSSRNAIPSTMTIPRRRRDELLLSTLRKVAFNNGIALIPTDSSSRVLELVYLLEHDCRKNDSWHKEGASVMLACKTAARTLRYAKSLLEWMDDSMIREFEATDTGNEQKQQRGPGGRGGFHNRGGNRQESQQQSQPQNLGPFDLRHVKLVEKRSQLMKMLRGKGGKVIIASDNSLEWGFTRDVLEYIANDSNNLVVLTERMDGASHSDVGSTLWKKWKAIAEDMDNEMGAMHPMDGSDWELPKRKRVPLTPAELVAHQQNLIAQQAHLATNLPGQSATADAQAGAADESDSSSSSESDDDDDDDPKQGKTLMSSHHANPMRKLLGVRDEDLGVNILIKGKGVYDFDVRGAKGRNRMFPFTVPRRKGDEYGEVVRAEDYLRAEEREDIIGSDPTGAGEKLEIVGFGGPGGGGGSGPAQDSGKESSRVFGRKRKWDNVNIGNASSGPRGSISAPGGLGRRQSYQQNSPAGKRRRRNTRGGYTRGGTSNGDGPPKEEESESESESSDEEDALLFDFTTPCKLVTTTTKLQLNLYVTFIDFEGLHDARSLRMLLPLINPRKLILVAGTEAETRSLAEDVSSAASSSGLEIEVFSPTIGTSLNASVDTNAWTVKLSEKLVKSLKWQDVRGMGVVHVVGRLVEEPDEDEVDEKKAITDGDEVMADENAQGKQRNLLLDLVPANTNIGNPRAAGGAAIHVGDIRLADLRRVLLEGGHTAEFRGEGTLLCDGVVVIRKEGVGKISVEDSGGGLLSGMGPRGRGAGIGKKGFGRFWEVRQRVYEGLAVVTSGGTMG